MITYPIHPFVRLSIGTLFAVSGVLVAGIVVSLWVGLLAGVSGILIAVGLVIVALALVALAIDTARKEVCEIRTYDDGRIVLVTLRKRRCVAASDISRLHGEAIKLDSFVFEEQVDPEPDAWWLRIEHSTGNICLPEFHWIREFAERVRALNPDVEITGMWPMGTPGAHDHTGLLGPAWTPLRRTGPNAG